LNEAGEGEEDEGGAHLHHHHQSAGVVLNPIILEPTVAASTNLFVPKVNAQFSGVVATRTTIHSSRGAATVTFTHEKNLALFTVADTIASILVSKAVVAEVGIIGYTIVILINAAMAYLLPSAILATDGRSAAGGSTVRGFIGAVLTT
jgi:hypothetical protein